jgi:DAK2 domain fusion protein YloV
VLDKMKESLIHTPDLLFALKEAGVIDSGGAGLVYVVEGFIKALKGDFVTAELAVTDDGVNKKQAVDFSLFTENDVMQFGYCTELFLRLQNFKCDVDKFSVETLISFLESVGDSVVAFKNDSIVKIHVHTFTPQKVLEYCQTFGEFLTVKIENMTLQHNESHEKKSALSDIKVERARREFAVVTVANGEGLKNTFIELGADEVIDGGQTNNPSAQTFIETFKKVNADHIFVLPNNSNIILAVKQAKELFKESDVRVIESKNIGQGYSALSMLDFSSGDADEIEKNMISDMQGVTTGMVSISVRNAEINGINIKNGEYVGFAEKTMLASSPDKMQVFKTLLEKIVDKEKGFAIIVFGNGASDIERESAMSIVNENCPWVESYEIDGGQDIYDFIIITE